jgi:hypothetical protein
MLQLTRSAAAARLQPFEVLVTMEGKQLAGLHLELTCFSEAGIIRATTSSKGVAVFHLHEQTVRRLKEGRPLPPYTFRVDSDDAYSNDFVIETPQPYGSGMKIPALRSAKWQMRTTPRVCDEIVRVGDIPVGGMASMSARELNSWYSKLSRKDLATCKTLVKLQADVGSLAPWYFYAYKGEEHRCVGGRAEEIDWATWYRELLEKATGANPGNCESDWERWWSSKGYDRVPDPPHPKALR